MIGLNDSFSASRCARDHLDNNKILALNIQGAHARLPPAPDQEASWNISGSLLGCTLEPNCALLSALLCSALLSGLSCAFCIQDGSKTT